MERPVHTCFRVGNTEKATVEDTGPGWSREDWVPQSPTVAASSSGQASCLLGLAYAGSPLTEQTGPGRGLISCCQSHCEEIASRRIHPLAGKGQEHSLMISHPSKCKFQENVVTKLPEVRQEINLVNFGYGKAFFFQINVLNFLKYERRERQSKRDKSRESHKAKEEKETTHSSMDHSKMEYA